MALFPHTGTAQRTGKMTLHPPPSQEKPWRCFTTHTTHHSCKTSCASLPATHSEEGSNDYSSYKIAKGEFSFTPKNADLMKQKTDSDEHNLPCLLLLILIFPIKISTENGAQVLSWPGAYFCWRVPQNLTCVRFYHMYNYFRVPRPNLSSVI